ncbi:hypothetical protein ACGFYY_35240 [Streptomyces sp. NPDC048331]|uniref:hypothetical protein n=1 Tax=Streptomyces sp. NPDC048331 TaxID=3365534 RepID=UPI003710CFD5
MRPRRSWAAPDELMVPGDVAALGGLLAVAAEHSPALARGRVRAAADAFEQAARHRAQELRAQAKAAAEAAVLLREAAALTGSPPPTTKPRTGRVVRTAHRGLPAAGPVTGVPACPRPGQGPPDRPATSATSPR